MPSAARPAAVRPRPHHEVVGDGGAAGADRPVRAQRTHQVLGVEPAADGEHGRRQVAEVAPDRARPPEIVVARVLEVDPVVDVLEQPVALGPAPQRPHVQEELVAARGPVLEAQALRRRGRVAGARLEEGVEAEVRGEHERAVVERVVAQVVVGDGRLRRNRLQRGVRVDHPRRHVEAGIRDPPHPDAPVVAGHVLHQPVDRVPGVRALVDVLARGLCRVVRPHLDPVAVRHVAPAHVLVGDDEAGLREVLGGADARRGTGRRRRARRSTACG